MDRTATAALLQRLQAAQGKFHAGGNGHGLREVLTTDVTRATSPPAER